jgi:hypothetical protein
MEHTRGQQQNEPPQPPDSGPAVDEHGRAVTANRQAAAWYRQAQRAIDCQRATRALKLAVTADPAFGLAVADLRAINGTSTQDSSSKQMNWERHHIEVVSAASTGDSKRAAGLLREHLANVGCDPLAVRIAIRLRQLMPNEAGLLPPCHPTPWSCST